MEAATFSFVALNLFFGVVFFVAARLIIGRRGNPVLWAYVVATLVFVYWLFLQEYSSDVGVDVLLTAHLLMIGYLAIVLVTARSRLDSVQTRTLILALRGVSNGHIAFAISAWLSWRVYLLSVYGPAGLAFSRSQVTYSTGVIEFATWESALSSITTMMLLGAFAAMVIREAAGEPIRSALLKATAIVLLFLVVVTNESPIGSRRLLLILFALWFSVAWLRSGVPLWVWTKRRLKALLLAVTAVAGISLYYQSVRNNDFTELLDANGLGELAAAIFRFATTIGSDADQDDVQLLRSGPFDFFAKVVDVWLVEGRSTRGEASAFSMAIAVPKSLYPGVKPVGDVDEVLYERLAIYPSKPFIAIDYPTSLPAIGMADFGPIGVMAAALALGACFVAASELLRRFAAMRHSTVLLLGLLVQLIATQEAGLTAIFAALRDASLALMAVIVIHRLTRMLRRSLLWRRSCYSVAGLGSHSEQTLER